MAKEKVEKKEKVDKKAKVEKTEKNNKKAKIDTKLTVQKKENIDNKGKPDKTAPRKVPKVEKIISHEWGPGKHLYLKVVYDNGLLQLLPVAIVNKMKPDMVKTYLNKNLPSYIHEIKDDDQVGSSSGRKRERSE